MVTCLLIITEKACENDLITAAQPYSHRPVCHHSVKQWNRAARTAAASLLIRTETILYFTVTSARGVS